jgi:hypothetical protein
MILNKTRLPVGLIKKADIELSFSLTLRLSPISAWSITSGSLESTAFVTGVGACSGPREPIPF